MPVFSNVRRAAVGALRWGMFFSVGSALILKEKTEEFVSTAVERGQEAQQEGKKLVREMRVEKPKRRKEVVDPLETRVNATLERLNIPTETEIRELNQQIAALSARIDEMQSATEPD